MLQHVVTHSQWYIPVLFYLWLSHATTYGNTQLVLHSSVIFFFDVICYHMWWHTPPGIPVSFCLFILSQVIIHNKRYQCYSFCWCHSLLNVARNTKWYEVNFSLLISYIIFSIDIILYQSHQCYSIHGYHMLPHMVTHSQWYQFFSFHKYHMLPHVVTYSQWYQCYSIRGKHMLPHIVSHSLWYCLSICYHMG